MVLCRKSHIFAPKGLFLRVFESVRGGIRFIYICKYVTELLLACSTGWYTLKEASNVTVLKRESIYPGHIFWNLLLGFLVAGSM